MITSIAEYYSDELHDWKSSVDLYIEGIDNSEEWLKTLLQLDSVPAMAARVEHYLNQLFLSKENLLQLRSRIQHLEAKLYKDQAPVANELISEEIRKQHKKLRKEVHKTEKEYLDVKYACDDFLADAVDIQNKIKSNN